jgi:serine/threonine protein kinase
MPDEPQTEDTGDLPQTVNFPQTPPVEGSAPAPAGTADQETNSSTTNFVPSFRAPMPGQPPLPSSAGHTGGLPCPGQQFGDFDILRVLGAGAFATVFLARQISLDRSVALKVSANRGSEARTLARLEHDHIVRVFSEAVEPELNQRVVCMQFVAGTTLEKVIHKLGESAPSTWSGRAILEAIDAVSTHTAVFDPAALRDREQLMDCDFVEAVCWIGNRLADALAHAHNQGVLHRDIKPANILMNRYGRPMLADFNVSFNPQRVTGPSGEIFGGTLGYMAPEHIDAFNPLEKNTTPAAVDERSDIYSLGLVLYELLIGKLPFGALPKTTKVGESLRQLARQRRSEVPSPRAVRAEIPEVLDRVVRRCLMPDPARRYQTAAELSAALKGCQDHRRMEKDLPRGGIITRTALRHPMLVGLALMFLPQVLGSIVNISYNSLRIVGQLTAAQQATFERLILVYNAVLYPLALVLVVRLLTPVVRTWRQLSGTDIPEEAEVARVRRGVLRLPAWAVVLACLGWLPGGLLFPLGIDWFAGLGETRTEVYLHFMISFTISCLIALTYTMFAVQFLVLRVLYPRLWVDARGLRHESRVELGPLDWRLAISQLLAGLIPLAGAVLMVVVSPDAEFKGSYRMFRILVTALIVLGMLGFTVSLSASRQLQQIFAALIGSERRRDSSRRADTTTFISVRRSG